jgi:hypothetical protein
VVYTKTQVLSFNGNRPSSEFNLTAWKPQKDPAYPLIALPRTKWDSNQFAISTGPEPIWIDFVVNNLDEGSHPFHLVSYTPVHSRGYSSFLSKAYLLKSVPLIESMEIARTHLLRPNNPPTQLLGLLQPLL